MYYLPTALTTEGGDPDSTPAADGKPLTNPTLSARAGLCYAIISATRTLCFPTVFKLPLGTKNEN